MSPFCVVLKEIKNIIEVFDVLFFEQLRDIVQQAIGSI